jgi:Domain of unknown function (DUF6484)
MLKLSNETVSELSADTESVSQERRDLSELLESALKIDHTSRKDQPQIHGVITGKLTGFDETGSPMVTFPEFAATGSVTARSIVALSGNEFGREVVLMFESGDIRQPIVMGLIKPAPGKKPENSLSIEIDGERVILNAEKEITLRCGNASLTLTRAGKVLIRGAYVSSRSSGVNRIKGGSIQLN